MHNLNNSFILSELCRTCAELQRAKWITSLPIFHTEPEWLLLFTSYLAEIMNHEDWIEDQATLDENYVFATLRCLWYLQVSTWQVHF